MIALSITDLAVSRGGRVLFAGLSLTLRAGEAVVLTGPNGAGKTSLLRAVAGLLRPDAGEIAFEGADAETARETALHFLGHHDGLKAGRTAAEELAFWTRWLRGDAMAGAVAAFDLAHLLPLEVRRLSAGQRRRLSLARLLAAPRPLWLLDEPLAPLDADRRARFGEVLAAHLAGGGLVLAAAHDPLPVPAREFRIGSPFPHRGGREPLVTALLALFRRELAAGFGRGGGPLFAVAFYLGVATLLPLAEGPSPDRLRAVAPGGAFVALALASLLSLERLFERDFEDGALDLLALGAAPLELVAYVKCKAQWLATGAPLALAAPVVAVMLGAPASLAPVVFLAALLAGFAFAFTGGIGAAVTLGARRGGLLTAVIVLPLYAPPVVFGAGAVEAFAEGLPWLPALGLLAAYALAAAALAPFAMAAACRSALG